jgi:hypothetical protein
MCEMGLVNGRIKGPRRPEVEPENRRARVGFQQPYRVLEVLEGRSKITWEETWSAERRRVTFSNPLRWIGPA